LTDKKQKKRPLEEILGHEVTHKKSQERRKVKKKKSRFCQKKKTALRKGPGRLKRMVWGGAIRCRRGRTTKKKTRFVEGAKTETVESQGATSQPAKTVRTQERKEGLARGTNQPPLEHLATIGGMLRKKTTHTHNKTTKKKTGSSAREQNWENGTSSSITEKRNCEGGGKEYRSQKRGGPKTGGGAPATKLVGCTFRCFRPKRNKPEKRRAEEHDFKKKKPWLKRIENKRATGPRGVGGILPRSKTRKKLRSWEQTNRWSYGERKGAQSKMGGERKEYRFEKKKKKKKTKKR